MTAMETLIRRHEVGEDLHSVVRVMKSLSAVSIKQFDAATDVVRDYQHTIQLALQTVLKQLTLSENPPSSRGKTGLVIVIGSDRGLCGRFNDGVATRARITVEKAGERGEAALILSIGARAAEHLERLSIASQVVLSAPPAVTALAELVESLIVHIDQQRDAADIKKISVIYNTRANGNIASVVQEDILPVSKDWLHAIKSEPWPSRGLPTFSVTPDEYFSTLIREYLFTRLFQAITESAASEHASRLAAMQRADRHIEDFLSTLHAEIRELRQSSITQELLDIVASYGVLQSRRSEKLQFEAKDIGV